MPYKRVKHAKSSTVYLIHFDKPYLRGDGKRLQHYMGATALHIDDRMARHRAGHGSALMRAVTNAGITWAVVRIWSVRTKHAAFLLEIKLKRRRRHKVMCPICRPVIISTTSTPATRTSAPAA